MATWTTGGFPTWRHLQGIEGWSDERWRGDSRGKGRLRHAYGTGKDRRLQRTHTDCWLLRLRHLQAFTKTEFRQIMASTAKIKNCVVLMNCMISCRFTCGTGATTDMTDISSGCCASDRPLWLCSSGSSNAFLTVVHSGKDGKQFKIQPSTHWYPIALHTNRSLGDFCSCFFFTWG